MRPKGRPGARHRRGAAMAEMAVVLAVFFLLVLGIVEVAQLGMLSNLVTSAANTACRVAVIDGHSQEDVASTVSGVMAAAGVGSSSYTMQTLPPDVTKARYGDTVTVTVSVPFRGVSWLGPPQFFASWTISYKATLSCERP